MKTKTMIKLPEEERKEWSLLGAIFSLVVFLGTWQFLDSVRFIMKYFIEDNIFSFLGSLAIMGSLTCLIGYILYQILYGYLEWVEE